MPHLVPNPGRLRGFVVSLGTGLCDEVIASTTLAIFGSFFRLATSSGVSWWKRLGWNRARRWKPQVR